MPDDPEIEPDLIDRPNAGDRSAGDELFTQVYRRLVHLSRLMLGTFRDLSRQHDAESLVHLGWIDLQTALRSVKPEGLPSYLSLAATKARLALLDIAEKERRRIDTGRLGRAAVDREDATPAFEPAAGSSCDPGRLELWGRFHAAVSELPDELREAFELYFYTDEKPNQAEVAKMLGLPARRVRRLIVKAKDRLAERVSGLSELLC
jgi:RNA polymerase sigma factor (sigma-70 family)